MITDASNASETSKLKSRAALASIIASAALTIGKLVAGLLSGSLALISEGLHGLLDTGATILTWFAVRAGEQRPVLAEPHVDERLGPVHLRHLHVHEHGVGAVLLDGGILTTSNGSGCADQPQRVTRPT